MNTNTQDPKNITPADSVVPVYLVPLTDEELKKREEWAIEQEQREAAEQARVDAKKSALEKLALLGLTEAEAEAVISL